MKARSAAGLAKTTPRALAPAGVVAAVGSIAAALLFAAACPPHEYWALGWLAPALFLVPIGRLAPRRAALCGVLFGTVWGSAMAGWMRDASRAYFGFGEPMGYGFVLAVAFLYAGIPNAALGASWASLRPRVPPAWYGLLAAWLWAASEIFRTHVFTGLPWELLGHTQFRILPVIQIADLGGAYAVSFLMAFVSVSVGEWVLLRDGATRAVASVRRGPVPALALLGVTLAYGAWCRSVYDRPPAPDAPTAAVIQGNVPNELRWKREHFERTLLVYAALTSRVSAARPDLVVWPENAVNFYLREEPMLTPVLASAASRAREGLIVGGPRRDDEGRSYNSAYLLDGRGMVRATYDKRRLLPFAEYNPLRGSQSVPLAGPIEFSAGDESTVLATERLRLGALICYEMLFPGLLRDVVRRGAEILVNISNDSWLDGGDGAAPKQHFSMVVFSAVAARRHLVRASASGVSGFVTPYGSVHGVVDLATEGVAVARVEPRRALTAYVRWGDAWLLLPGTMLVLAAVWTRRRRRP